MTKNARTLVLFNYDWDASAFARLTDGWRLDHAGFDLFSFPSCLRLATFELENFVERPAQRARRGAWSAVVSHHEQFGALGAALLAERMGWPARRWRRCWPCQHKLYARQVLQRVCPEANLPFAPLQARYGDPIPHGLHYPAFAKPVKAAFSVLARRVANHAQLTALTRFGPLEQWIIHRLVEPFDRIARSRLGDVPSAHGMLLEEPVDAPQFNLDGCVFRGQVHAIGVVDAVMYPGTGAFQRFERPAAWPSACRSAHSTSPRAFSRPWVSITATSTWSSSTTWPPTRLKVIEFNPRLASQCADLYRRVDGIDAHAGSLALAQGRDPASAIRAARPPREPRRASCSAASIARGCRPRRRSRD